MDLKKTEYSIPKENYKFLLIGFVTIIIGFILMIGGKAETPDQFNEAIFSAQRITIAPIVVLLGFIVVGFGIMKRPKI